MKRIDKLVLDAFLGPFLITFLVVVFILLNINMLKYFDDIIGKGLDNWTLGQLFFYFGVFTIPTALPLAVLLSSLISFGNLGEHFELTAIKAAGVSLLRAMQPIFLFVILLTGAAFYANNYLVPKAALEAYSLLYDIKHKKPAFDLREGSFYYGIDNISIKIDKKYPDGITLKNVIVYDHRKNDGNKEVTIADSGKMYSILNDRYLKFELFRGYHYTEGATNERALAGKRGKNSESLSRSQFSKSQVVFDLSSFDIKRTDKQWFQGNKLMRDMKELDNDVDSIHREILAQRLSQYQFRNTFFNYYLKNDSIIMPPDVRKYQLYRDSLEKLKYQDRMPPQVTSADAPEAQTTPDITTNNTLSKPETKSVDTVKQKLDTEKRRKSMADQVPAVVKSQDSTKRASMFSPRNMVLKHNEVVSQAKSLSERPSSVRTKPVPPTPKPKPMTDSARLAKLDSVFNIPATANTYQAAGNSARHTMGQVTNINDMVDNYETEARVVNIQWHKIIASSFACIAMFLIGAPLGAIIKRGGLGVPFLVSILFFIIYYVFTMQGEKLAKQQTVGIIAGVWMADAILFVVGLFFLKQARADARLFEADFYSVAFDKIKRRIGRKRAVKPNYN